MELEFRVITFVCDSFSDPLEHAVVTGVPFFVKHAAVLIGAVREIVIAQGDLIPGNYNQNLFTSFIHIMESWKIL